MQVPDLMLVKWKLYIKTVLCFFDVLTNRYFTENRHLKWDESKRRQNRTKPDPRCSCKLIYCRDWTEEKSFEKNVIKMPSLSCGTDTLKWWKTERRGKHSAAPVLIISSQQPVSTGNMSSTKARCQWNWVFFSCDTDWM